MEVFGFPIEWTRFFRASLKTLEINSTHRELFKNPKIIKIGSQNKKLQHFQVGDIGIFFEIQLF